MWFRRTRPSAESGFGVFRPGEGLLRGPPSGEGPFTGHSAPLNRMSQQMRYPSRWTSGRCRPAERPLSRLRMATSVRFRSKQPPILTWSPGFWAVFRGRCSISALPTWENAGGLRPLGSIPPAKPPRSSEGAASKRTQGRGWCRAPALAGCDSRKARSYPVAA